METKSKEQEVKRKTILARNIDVIKIEDGTELRVISDISLKLKNNEEMIMYKVIEIETHNTYWVQADEILRTRYKHEDKNVSQINMVMYDEKMEVQTFKQMYGERKLHQAIQEILNGLAYDDNGYASFTVQVIIKEQI